MATVLFGEFPSPTFSLRGMNGFLWLYIKFLFERLVMLYCVLVIANHISCSYFIMNKINGHTK